MRSLATSELPPDEWQQRVRADLAWALNSRPLVRAEVWQAAGVQLATCGDWVLPDGLPSPQDHDGIKGPVRLGHHFELIHGFLMRRQAKLRVLALNRRICSAARTLGELDCLYETSTQVVHRELAVKFYLGREDSSQAHTWVGPGKVDRLDLKLARMLAHQTQMPRLAEERGAWPQDLAYPTKTEVLLTGAFFKHPNHSHWPAAMHEGAETGFWCTSQEFALATDGFWARLRKPWWLSPLHSTHEPTLSVPEIVSWVESSQSPCFVACAPPRHTSLGQRGFVVPHSWTRC